MNKSRGFTLIETLVAITIITIAMSGALFVANSAVISAQITHNQLTASYLAQEGVEYVRMMRDNEYLASYHAGGPTVSLSAWTNFISGTDPSSITQCHTPAFCMLDPTRSMGTGSGLSLQPCSGASCTPLYFANNIYTQQNMDGSVQTPFTRTIQVVDVSATEIRVISKVSWSSHLVPYSVSVIAHLTPWQ